MNKRHILLLVCGLAMGLALVLLGSLASAQEPVPQGDLKVHISSVARHIEKREFIRPPAGRVVSRVVSIEPVQLQLAERVAMEAQVPLTVPPLPKAQVIERYHAFQRVRREFKALIGQVVDEAYPISFSASTRTLASEVAWPAAECVVNSTADSGPGTLRQCLQDANPGDTITFDGSIFPSTSPATILLSSALPWISIDSLTIDASDAGVVLDGSGLSSCDGFTIVGADGVSIRGLQILRFPSYGVSIITGTTNTTIGGDRFTGSRPLGQGNLISGNRWGAGVRIEGIGTTSNTVQGNLIGTDVSGTSAFGNVLAGMVVLGGAANNVIGGDTPGTRNLISSNLLTGIWIEGAGTSGNQVLGNYIGTDISGTASLGHNWDGVFIGHGAANNIVSDNLIGSSGDGAGVWIQNIGTAGNQLIGNYIGTDAFGAAALPNYYGVQISGGAADNIIGGSTSGARNLISGNGYPGVAISGSGTSGNRILGNYIGTDITGTTALSNALFGVIILDGATDNVIGGDVPGAGNLISGNASDGVVIQDPGTLGNRVIGNYIGVDVSGTISLSNRNGVVINDAASNVIGGDNLGERNLISGNRDAGIWMQRAGTCRNQVLGNYIGTDTSGTGALGNGDFGILISFGAADNIIGGNASGARNLISGNEGAGVWIQNTGTMSNTVQGNYIGICASGTVSLGNAASGVTIIDGPTGNIIGGDMPETRNIISGNKGDAGMEIVGNGTKGNFVIGNYIGTNVSGTASLANVEHGVAIYGEATDNIVGGATPQERNLISGNGQAGVVLYSQGTLGNQVIGNYVGTDASGTTSVPNLWGVFIGEGAANNTVGGTVSGTRNLISGNGETGVRIEDSETVSNTVLGNYIGTNFSGTVSLPNEYGVVVGFGATNNTIGGCTSEARNLISGNSLAGVVIWDAGDTSGNQVLGNYIGTDVSGTASLPNRWGVYIASGATNNMIGGDPGVGNLISGNGESGVWIQDAGTSANQVPGNFIGASAGYGVFIGSGATSNTIGVSNTIVYNALAGVVVSGTNTLYNTVTRNVIHHNGGLPIDLVAWPIPVLPPQLDDFTCLDNTVWGTACPGCRVEVFANPTTTPAGTVFVGDVVAVASGHFSLTVTSLPLYQYLAATATDLDGTTSQFSNGFLLAGGALTPASITVTVSSSATVIYTHTLTNVGQCTDTFALSAASELGWLETYQPLQVTLDRGMTATLTVTITVPDGLTKRAIDKTVVTATSGLIPCAIATAEDIVVLEFKIHLPLVIRDYEESG